MAMNGSEEPSPQGDVEQEHARPRKRTRRACDKCSSSRTRCDGECPCRRCEDYGYTCRYNREVKKRGRLPANASAASRAESWRRRREEASPSGSSTSLVSPDVGSAGSQYAFAAPAASSEGRAGLARATSMDIDGPREETARMSAPLSVDSLIQPQLAPGAGLEYATQPRASRTRAGPPSISAVEGHPADAEALLTDESVAYPPSPNGLGAYALGARPSNPVTFGSVARADPGRGSFSTSRTAAEGFTADFLQKAPTEECCYPFLEPVLPYIRNIIPASVACDLLDIFLTDPGSSLFRGASPYILTRIFRKKSILDPANPRQTTPALLATILWCVAQTADIIMLHVPGTRAKVVNDLYELATSLTSERDPDRWRRVHGGLRAEKEIPHPAMPNPPAVPTTTATNEPAGAVDDVLTFILLAIAVSGSDFKSDCFKWWSKATRLALSLGLNREDERCSASVSPCANPLCSCRRDGEGTTLASIEHREERRRVFWLLYSLDRHLSLSFNTALSMPDSYCEVYAPLPDSVWETLDSMALDELPSRAIGPPTTISGTGFLEYFLPLMAILGDIVEVHHRREHPRLGNLDDSHSVSVIQDSLAAYELSLEALEVDSAANNQPAASSAPHRTTDPSRIHLVKAYSTLILNVLHVLLHGKWDAISMLDDGDDWITSKRFNQCAGHAITASQSVSRILALDPELTFMSYLFGIYLLQGSFILLLFADRMPQLGPNESVEQACENIIRAHEVCVVTLSTEFQKNFRRVLRSTLYSVRGSGTTNWEEHRARRRALSLYRWSRGAKGLGL